MQQWNNNKVQLKAGKLRHHPPTSKRSAADKVVQGTVSALVATFTIDDRITITQHSRMTMPTNNRNLGGGGIGSMP